MASLLRVQPLEIRLPRAFGGVESLHMLLYIYMFIYGHVHGVLFFSGDGEDHWDDVNSPPLRASSPLRLFRQAQEATGRHLGVSKHLGGTGSNSPPLGTPVTGSGSNSPHGLSRASVRLEGVLFFGVPPRFVAFGQRWM